MTARDNCSILMCVTHGLAFVLRQENQLLMVFFPEDMAANTGRILSTVPLLGSFFTC